jgi:hypothetical protein
MTGRLSWVQADRPVPLLLEPGAARHRDAWVEHAERVSVRRLGDEVERALVLGEFAPPPLDSSAAALDPDADPAGLQTSAIARFEKESERLFFSAVPEVAQLFRAVLATVQRRLERIRGHPCRPSDALEAMIDHALATWRPKKGARRDDAVYERDGWRCTVPGCTSWLYVVPQPARTPHRVPVAPRVEQVLESHDAVRLAPPARRARRYLLRCTGVAPDRLRFELGLRSDGPPLAVYRSGEVRMT